MDYFWAPFHVLCCPSNSTSIINIAIVIMTIIISVIGLRFIVFIFNLPKSVFK